MRKLTKLIKESIDLSMRMSWLNRIEKSLNKRHKIYQAYKREVFVTNELVKRYIDADKIHEFVDTKVAEGKDGWAKGVPYEWAYALTVIDMQPTADVVPKSEVDRLETEVKALTENSITTKYPNCVLGSYYAILTKSLEDYDKLIDDISSSTKAEVAREIFEEMQSCLIQRHWNGLDIVSFEFDAVKYAELKKKYTEEEK